MHNNMHTKVAAVTGANAGIGLATVRAFAQAGAQVVGASRSTEELDRLAQEYPVQPVAVDLATAEGVQHMADVAHQTFGRVDVLVNNVGIGPARESFLDISDDDWQLTIDTNFMSAVRAARAVLPGMVERGTGVIINISSESGRNPDLFLLDYSITKTALLSLTKVLAHEFGTHGIRVNTVSPGPTYTKIWDKPGGFADMLAQQFSTDRATAIQRFVGEVRQMPTQRIGRPEDVAAVILFLASDQAQQVTGAEYMVNGGSIKTI
jgi:NAD(P)-dependent dehydrogenase (short-subunit alcohol dehydrogenase family)